MSFRRTTGSRSAFSAELFVGETAGSPMKAMRMCERRHQPLVGQLARTVDADRFQESVVFRRRPRCFAVDSRDDVNAMLVTSTSRIRASMCMGHRRVLGELFVRIVVNALASGEVEGGMDVSPRPRRPQSL